MDGMLLVPFFSHRSTIRLNHSFPPSLPPFLPPTSSFLPQPHGAGASLSSLQGAPPAATPLILLVLSILVPETRTRPPPPEVVIAAKNLKEIR